MRTTCLAVLALAGCATSTDRAAALREQYRQKALDPDKVQACRKAPEKCGGYAGTYWRMSIDDVERATGCTWAGNDQCSTRYERYVFRSGALTAVLVDFPTYGGARHQLTQSLGEPGWEGSNTEGMNSRLDEARRKETSTLVAAALGDAIAPRSFGGFFVAQRAHEQVRDLEAKQRATLPMRCSAWNRALTRVLLCEEDGKRTTALFTSRSDPETMVSSVRDGGRGARR
jgi:hypothetical protein